MTDPWYMVPLVLCVQVNAACDQFSTPTAKVAWKGWALTHEFASVAVALAWWLVAHVFKPDDVRSAVRMPSILPSCGRVRGPCMHSCVHAGLLLQGAGIRGR
jgi:hypothetical protein